MHFEHFGSLGAPVPGLLVSLGIHVELGKKGLDINLILDGHRTRIIVFSEGQILVDVSLNWCLSDSSTA